MGKKVLITGSSGFLGRHVFREFKSDPDWETLGLAYSRTSGNLQQVDITDRNAVNRIVSEFKPNIIVHCAAERKPDVVENQPETAHKINVGATQFICEAASAFDAWVLYISTDYVFDGTRQPYGITDEPNPLNKYGKSKLEGEKVTIQVSEDNCVLRVPILYGYAERLGEDAVSLLFDKVKDTANKCFMSDYERRYPTHCDDVAYAIRQLADKRLQDKSIKGIFHWSGDENMTKYDMAIAMATVFGISSDHIEADKTPSSGASRPYDSHLDCSRIEQLGISKRTKFADGIKDVLKPFFT